MGLGNQLKNCIIDVSSCKKLSNLEMTGDLSRKLVETRKLITYPMMYFLLKLALVLHIATATFERSFSIVNFMKNQVF